MRTNRRQRLEWFLTAALLPLAMSAGCGSSAGAASCPPGAPGGSVGDAAADAPLDAGAMAAGGAGGAMAAGGAAGRSPALPPGAVCASGPNGTTADLPIAPPCPDETSGFSASQPLGVGFPDADDLLPPHVVYLTFDDGPSDWTAEILDTLAASGVHATFFVNAKNLKGAAGLDGTYLDANGNPAVYRDLVVRERDEGHAIGNHTVDHLDLAALTPASAAAELDDNERLVNAALVRAGRPARPLTLIRPPFGSPWFHHAPVPPDQTAAEIAVADIVAARGLEVLWTIDSTDSREWAQGESFTRRPGQITPDATAPSYADKIARVQQTVLGDPAVIAGAGAVILLHDSHNATRDALPAIIAGLRAAGYSFGTVEEFAMWRWGRSSLELTPGPTLYDACTPEKDWGCAPGDVAPVCGRFWGAFQRLGGATALGAPMTPASLSGSGALRQSFASGTIELHPELAAPCDVVLVPR